MYKRKDLLRIAELLGVEQHINPETTPEDEIQKIIVKRCTLGDSAIRSAIQNDVELSLDDVGKQNLITDLMTARGKREGRASPSSNMPISNSYSTLMLVGSINSFLGWLMVIGSVIFFIASLNSGGPSALAGLFGLVLIPIALLVVASGQAISCFVQTERNGKETTILLQRILDKMEAAEKR
jgi:hypothetical protein